MDIDHRGTLQAFLSLDDPVLAVRTWLAMSGVVETPTRRRARLVIADWLIGAGNDETIQALRELANANELAS